MANRVREEEKNERIIRSLLKLPENRRCINCNSLGPQYVCTNFWTFVCTACSGIHREFTHRVKSVSMARFTSQEVSALQGGGNARAKEIYFKQCDPQRHSVSDNSNVERLRDFIKHVYVDQRYSGERNFDKPPRARMGEAEDSYENRRTDLYQGGSRSPPYEDTYGSPYHDRPSPGGRSDDSNYRNNYDDRRSPNYEKGHRQYGDFRTSPSHSEIVNDWRREDRFGNGKRSGSMSPASQKDSDMSSPPMVRPVREILADSVTPLGIIEPPKANGNRAPDGFIGTQRTASSSSLASSNGNPAELRRETLGSLIDFDAVTEPATTAAMQQTQQTTAGQSMAQPTALSNTDNWACFDSVSEVKVSQAPPNAYSVESVLSQFSTPTSVPAVPVDNFTSFASEAAPVGIISASPFPSGPAAALPANSLTMSSSGGALAQATGSASVLADGGLWPGLQTHQHTLFRASDQSSAQPFTTPLGGGPSNQASQTLFKPALEVNSEVVTQQSSMEVKPSGRKELPEDLFGAMSASVQTPGWQSGAAHGYGLPMQYHAHMPMPTYPQPSKSMNPFDLHNDVSPVQAPMFPSMASLQGALPNTATPSGLLPTTSLNTPLNTWTPSQSTYLPGLPPQGPSYASTAPPSAFMGQPPPNLTSRQHGFMEPGSEGTAFSSLNSNQQLSGRYSSPATLNTFSSTGGNPFE